MKWLMGICLLACKVSFAQVVSKSSYDKSVFEKFYSSVNRHFKTVDRFHDAGKYDTLNSLNEEFITLLNKYKNEIFSYPDSANYDLIYLTKSKDKNLVLVSWDVRTGGSQIDFTTMAIYKTKSAIKTKMLYYDQEKASPLSYTHYNSIHTLLTADSTALYLALGNGQGSYALPMQGVTAFAIRENELIQPKIFPEQQSNVGVVFDLTKWKGNNSAAVIKFLHRGRTLAVPEEDASGGFGGRYTYYHFDGRRFK